MDLLSVSEASLSEEPLSYELKVSARAKRVTLRVLPGRGLVVTIPRRHPKREIPALVEKNKSWALEAIAQMEARISPDHKHWPPRRLHLKALDRTVELSFEANSKPPRVTARWLCSNQIVVAGRAEQREAVASAIAQCLRQEAKASLLTQLAFLSTRHGLHYEKAVIRGQKSVWGSYSSSGTLSLNYKLLFLPPELAEYVLLHELSHIRYLDHSEKFWALLESLQPAAKALDRQLATVNTDLPVWLEVN